MKARTLRSTRMLRPALLLLLCLAGAAACSIVPSGVGPDAKATPTPVISATPPAPTATPLPSHLTICLSQEPVSLYLYGDTNRAADVVLAAIYDGPFDSISFRPQPVLLDETPSLENGGIQIEGVPISFGDVYLNPLSLEPETLARGSPVLPQGCRSEECMVSYAGGELMVEQVTVRYHIRGNVRWSDGEPLTASDSVFTYTVDGDPDSATPKFLFARTYSYRALDEGTVEWVGLPGFLDIDPASSFWSPLPEHRLGDYSAAELQAAPGAVETPLGWGSYLIESWGGEGEIRLSRNPEYSLGPTPAFDEIVFRFPATMTQALADLRSGSCDVIDESLLPLEGLSEIRTTAAENGFTLELGAGEVIDRLDFNLSPLEGESMFADARTRRGLMACLEREALARSLFGDAGQRADSYVPPTHPAYTETLELAESGREQGAELLREAGWSLAESAGEMRSALDVEGVAPGTALAFSLSHLDAELPRKVASQVAAELGACGAQVELSPVTAAELFAPYPDGEVFGRQFDVVLWAWPTFSGPACEMFASWEIPSDSRPLGINASGIQDAAYDEACRQLIWSLPESEDRLQAEGAVLGRFREELPAIPLFVRPRLLLHADWVCGPELEPSNPATWNIEEWRPCS